MFKIATAPILVSAEQMYHSLVKDLLKSNKLYRARKHNHITNGEVYNSETDQTVITYVQFKQILARHNKKLGKKLLNGYTYDLQYGLGDMFLARIERPNNGRRLNRGASFRLRKKLKEEGTLTKENWKVPYTDDDFVMTMWHQGNGKLPNIKLYKFKAAGGQPGKGYKQLISNTLNNNPMLKALYPFFPCKVLEPQVV